MGQRHSAARGIFFATVALVLLPPVRAEEAAVHVRYRMPPTSSQACGVDALYVCMLASGAKGISLSSLDQEIPIRANGASLEDLSEACKRHGISRVAVRAQMADLMSWVKPTVLHVRDNHYVAFLGMREERLLVFDNAVGLIDCSPDYFADVYRWDGVALVIGPPEPKLLMQLYGPGIAFIAGGVLLLVLYIVRFHSSKISLRSRLAPFRSRFS